MLPLSKVARINGEGYILVEDGGAVSIYNIADKSYKVYYDKAKSSYHNWQPSNRGGCNRPVSYLGPANM